MSRFRSYLGLNLLDEGVGKRKKAGPGMPIVHIKNALGLGEGGAVRGAFEALVAQLAALVTPDATPAHQRVAFTIAFVALAAKMAKADGCVVPIEAETFHCMYEVHADEAVNVRHVFDLAAQDTAGFESYARQIAHAVRNEPRILRDVFDGLFHIAACDGILHPGEERYLRTVAGIFGINPVEFRAIRSAFVQGGAAAGESGDSAYDVLGVDRSIATDELKLRHRALVRDHHPDSLTARGIPEAFHAAAGRKLAVFNAAYDAILRERGLKRSAAVEGSVS
ncbi:MAG: TerB family tellurite resistance protein [Hyphomicrobiaceae bacterium]